ncbi:class II aldolase/adducin family protein [Pseudonocardia sp. TRM90224]|uniref:class II aldolase/adducin family protein n=1 Tax=Pseudonocardia sp. TRM90224 TaxID=2812678 RepID=UPI001E55F8C6|nr:class II aldolase/adducin family protein [Pseudonocardia sp. TRM90224]
MTPVSQVVAAHRALAVAGHGDLVWGHAAVRDPDGAGIWTKAAGWGFEEVTEYRVVLVSPDGDVLAGTGRRHIEYPIHTGILRARPDVGAVVHTHSHAATAFAALDVPLRALDHDGVLFSEPDVPRFRGTGGLIRTAALGADVAAALGDAPAVLLPRHGLVTVGASVGQAVMHAILLDRACRTQLTAMAAGELRSWSDAAECAAKRAACWNPTQIDAGWRYLLRAAGLPEETT